MATLLSGCTTAAGALAAQEQRCDYEGPSGICIQIDRNAKRVNPAALEAAYLQAKREVEIHYQLDLVDVPGPVVRVMAFGDFNVLHPTTTRLDGDTGGDHGWTDFRSEQIVITGGAVMRHESFHYLLLKAGYPNRLNAVHDHPAFDEYRDGQWLPRRASDPIPTTATQNSQAEPSSLSPSTSATASGETATR